VVPAAADRGEHQAGLPCQQAQLGQLGGSPNASLSDPFSSAEMRNMLANPAREDHHDAITQAK